MITYLRAVGFSNLDVEEVLNIRHRVLEQPDRRKTVSTRDNRSFAEYDKMSAAQFGLKLSGTLNDKEQLNKPLLIPFVISSLNVQIRQAEVHEVQGELVLLYEDLRTDNEIALVLQSKLAYEKDPAAFSQVLGDPERIKEVNLCGLSVFGTVLLSVAQDPQLVAEEERYYSSLVDRSKTGDEEAKELLAVYEAQSLDIIKDRLADEDLFSVIESYFLPMENDPDVSMYDILGTITDAEAVVNVDTAETIYKLMVTAAGVQLQIFINEDDLLGVPSEGMRFMGNCKLQGDVTF